MRTSNLYQKSVLFGAALLLVSGGAALGQNPGEEVTVNGADRITKEKMSSGPPFNHATRVTVSRSVSFADLDLSKGWGQTLLDIRVHRTARELCAMAAREMPGGSVSGEDADCVHNAVKQATVATNAAIASARSEPVRTAALP